MGSERCSNDFNGVQRDFRGTDDNFTSSRAISKAQTIGTKVFRMSPKLSFLIPPGHDIINKSLIEELRVEEVRGEPFSSEAFICFLIALVDERVNEVAAWKVSQICS